MEHQAVSLFLQGFERLYERMDSLIESPVLATREDREKVDCLAVAVYRELEVATARPEGIAPDVLKEIRYLLAVLMDEVVLYQQDSFPSELWLSRLVERRFFKSALAGQQFFQKIDQLRERFPLPENRQQLATIYLMALQLGFSGEYRDNPSMLDSYRSKLNLLRGEAPMPVPAFPQALRATAQRETPGKLASMRRWWAGVGIFSLLYLLASLLLWLLFVSTVESNLADQAAKQVTPPAATPAAQSALPQLKTDPDLSVYIPRETLDQQKGKPS